MAYPPLVDIVSASGVEALTTLTVSEAQVLYDSSRIAVEEFCGQSFDYEEGVTYQLDGNGEVALYLPKRLDHMTALVVTGAGLEIGDVTLSPERDRLTVRPVGLYQNYYTQALRELDDNLPLRFAYGVGNVAILGDWGWNVVPTPVFEAIRLDMEDTALADANALSQTLRAYRKLGIRDLSQGNLRATVGGSWGLSPEVMSLLRPYVWQGQIGVTI